MLKYHKTTENEKYIITAWEYGGAADRREYAPNPIPKTNAACNLHAALTILEFHP